MRPTLVLLSLVVVATLVGLVASPAHASFHLMQIEQVIGGVDGDVTAQAIQLRMRAIGQNLVGSARIRAFDVNGLNPVLVINIPGAVLNGNVGNRVLITSAAFDAATNPTANPDFAITNLIPASYLAAGSLTFENNFGTQVWWRLSWGGASYTGSTTGMGGVGANDSDGDFGVFAGPLPSSTTSALRFLGTATQASTRNEFDYAVTGGDAIFTNNSGQNFTVESQPTGVPPITVGIALRQNRPNPFNPKTEILFTMEREGHARLRVYDVNGRLVTTLFDGTAPAGVNRAAWGARDLQGRSVGSGVYYYRLTTSTLQETRRMVLLK
ncbi:MAG: T9SS type A sorting domain-containing protein [Candidatus Krumholzibacteria bacterium]|nr:T9SS type A sorting domain-containing protein [Candidatus Krumholzibacteria bacterium]